MTDMRCSQCGMIFESGRVYGFACPKGSNCGPMAPVSPMLDPMPRVDLTLPPPAGYVPRKIYDDEITVANSTITALRADLAEAQRDKTFIIEERDRTFALMLARAETAEAALRSQRAEALRDFDKADWFWRAMDPDDCGDNPAEAISRSMLGPFVVCEICSSFSGPTRFGFVAPVLDPESDDEEFLHFGTQDEAIEAARKRRAMIDAPKEQQP